MGVMFELSKYKKFINVENILKILIHKKYVMFNIIANKNCLFKEFSLSEKRVDCESATSIKDCTLQLLH